MTFASGLDAHVAERVQETLEWVAPHCDLERRLPQIPPSAKVRGIWSKILDKQLQERGLHNEYRRLLPLPAPSALRFHPVSDLCVQTAVAGALIAGPENLHTGMYEITRDNASRFAASLLGRTLIRLLAHDPKRLAQQAIASRRQTCNYGSWELRSASDHDVRFYMREEYIWIDSYLAGSAVGTYEVIGSDVEAEVDLEDMFHGTMTIRWK